MIESSKLSLRWVVYSSIYDTDYWDSVNQDGYQIASEVVTGSQEILEDENVLQGACVQALNLAGNPTY